MALPVAPPPKSNDVAVLHWAALTVRVAWTLLSLGVKVRPEVLREARAHALYHLDPATPLTHAEDLVARRTEEFVARARGKVPEDPCAQDWEMPLSPRWRRALERSLDPLGEAVFKKHYGDNRGLGRLEQALGVDRVALEAVQSGLREVVRRIAVTDGLPLDRWSTARVDRLLKRLAAWSPGPCPPPLDIAEGCHREHVAACPRCDRMHRLLRTSVIEVDDLFPPSIGARPNGRAKLLVLQLHPDARRARRRLLEELAVPAFPLGEELILVDGDRVEEVAPVIRIAAEVAAPERSQLRGALLEGPGTWTPRGLLGPLPEKALTEVLQRSWATVEGVGPLPEALPPPPSARPWWAAVGLLAAGCVATLGLALAQPDRPADDRIDAAFTAGRGGTWVAFDVPEPAVVTLVALREGMLAPVVVPRDAADKADLATGDGGYRVHVPGQGLALLASEAPIPRLDKLILAANASSDPLGHLLSSLPPGAHGRVFHR